MAEEEIGEAETGAVAGVESAFLLPSFTLSLVALLAAVAGEDFLAAAAAVLPATGATVDGTEETIDVEDAEVGEAVVATAEDGVPLLVRLICSATPAGDDTAGVVDSILIVCPLLVVMLVVPASDETVGLLADVTAPLLAAA